MRSLPVFVRLLSARAPEGALVSARAPKGALRRAGPAVLALGVSLFGLSAVCDTARASGPVERLVQVLNAPGKPAQVVVRYGVATEGFLFSSDGGRTFKAMCSQAITPTAEEREKLRRISSQNIPSNAATLIDANGKLVVGQLGALWSDDGTGCSWSKDPAMEGQWAYSLRLDPKTSELLAVVNSSTGEGNAIEAQSKLMRRAADGSWTTGANLVPHVATQRAYGGDLIVGSTASGTRLYASVTVSLGDLETAKESSRVVSSDDGGKTWSEGAALPAEQQELALLAVDPLLPDRILAALSRDSASDTLLLSDDKGKTFRVYSEEVREVSGATFAADGRVFVGDSGDSSGDDAAGGVWTATKLGEPLSRIAGTPGIDCIGYAADSNKLQVCSVDKFGFMDPLDGKFEQTTEIGGIEALIECPGVDVVAACETQLNGGPSWCCTGHYSFTPFCGQYNVTMAGGRKLYCGLAGREYDITIGRGPADAGVADAGSTGSADAGSGAPRPAADAGKADAGTKPTGSDPAGQTRDAGTPTPTKSSGDDGCAVHSPGAGQGLAGLFTFILSALALSVRNARSRARARVRSFARAPEGALPSRTQARG